ncbi:MAG: hypothetical protein WC120_00205 [Parcubacteria group bacterium]
MKEKIQSYNLEKAENEAAEIHGLINDDLAVDYENAGAVIEINKDIQAEVVEASRENLGVTKKETSPKSYLVIQEKPAQKHNYSPEALNEIVNIQREDISKKYSSQLKQSEDLYAELLFQAENMSEWQKRQEKKTIHKLKKIFRIRSADTTKIKEELIQINNKIKEAYIEIEIIKIKIKAEEVLGDILKIRADLPVLSEQDFRYNPYKAKKYTDFNVFEHNMEIINRMSKIILAMKQLDVSTDEIEAEYNSFQNYYQKINIISEAVKLAIAQIERELWNCEISPERNISVDETRQNMLSICRKSEQYADGLWNLDEIAKSTADELVVHINTNGSGRCFLHSFPEISIENGYITTSMGAGENFKHVRGDSRCWINFSCESSVSGYDKSFYGTLNTKLSGGVYYPAEVILENYPFINLPYDDGKDHAKIWTSSEWRSYAPRDNAKSKFHRIPLNLGICFFSLDDRDTVEKYINALPDSQKPNKIIWYSGQEEVEALTSLLKKIKTPDDLPHLTSPIKIIQVDDGLTMFGTDKTKRIFDEEMAEVKA